MSEMILYHGTTRVLKDPGNRTEELLCHREAEPAKAAAASLPNGGYLNIYRFETEGLTEGTDYSVLNREVLIKSVEAKKQLKHLAFGPVDKRADGIGKEDIKNRMEVLGELFSCVAGKGNEDITSFFRAFSISGLAGEWENGRITELLEAGGSGLYRMVKEKTGLWNGEEETAARAEDAAMAWTGSILAYLQWRSGKRFSDILEDLPVDQIERFYPTLHALTKEQCFDVLREKIRQNGQKSWIQRQRKRAGLSQKELAERSGVNLRTLQQYEIRDKDINKAALSKVLSMARVLHCRPEDLMEW